MSRSNTVRVKARAAVSRRPATLIRLDKRLSENAVRRQIASRIRYLRRQLRMKQLEFGMQIGVKQACVSAYEHGRVTPRLHEIPLICIALKCDPNSLFKFPKYRRRT